MWFRGRLSNGDGILDVPVKAHHSRSCINIADYKQIMLLKRRWSFCHSSRLVGSSYFQLARAADTKVRVATKGTISCVVEFSLQSILVVK